MAITNFSPRCGPRPSSPSSTRTSSTRAPCVNRNYEGEISAYGDTVHIVSIADPTIVDYTKDTDLTSRLTDSEQLLLIDQAKAFAFEVDDIDMRQSRNGGALMTEAANRAGFGLRDKADQYVAAKMAPAPATRSAWSTRPRRPTSTTSCSSRQGQARPGQRPDRGPLDRRRPGRLRQAAARQPVHQGRTSPAPTRLHNGVVGKAAGFTS
jgi:hypothetical protein